MLELVIGLEAHALQRAQGLAHGVQVLVTGLLLTQRLADGVAELAEAGGAIPAARFSRTPSAASLASMAMEVSRDPTLVPHGWSSSYHQCFHATFPPTTFSE